MRFQDIAEKIKSGEWKLDFCGHQCHEGDFLERYEDTLADANGANDDKWSNRDNKKSMAEVNADMRKIYQMDLDREFGPGDVVRGFFFDGHQCFSCGKKWHFVLGEKTLFLRASWDGDKYAVAKNNCEFETPKPFGGEIEVASKLIFANYFPSIDDTPEEEKHYNEWCLNFLIGRKNITAYKAERNVAYGQMGNMSVGIFINDDKTSIIVGDPWVADRLTDGMTEEEYEAADHDALSMIEGHKFIGDICCEIWRWEATDYNTIKDCYEKVTKKQDTVELDVPHGTWSFTHYYRTGAENKNESIYARMVLK